MRCRVNFQEMPFSYISSESRVRATHPLRHITAVTDQMLHGLSPTFAEIFGTAGCPPRSHPSGY